MKKTPVQLLVGYLGSGKTTLVKRITANLLGEKVAVIQNEFSNDMGVEVQVMMDAQGNPVEGFYELPNGCLCCTIRDSLVATIEMILKQDQEMLANDSNYKTVDRVIVECSGVADPLPIVDNFWVDDELLSNMRLQGTIAVADASRIRTLLKDESIEEECPLGYLICKQISCADIIYLNKCDKIDSDEIATIFSTLRAINPSSEIKSCTDMDIDLSELFAFSTTTRPEALDKHRQSTGHSDTSWISNQFVEMSPDAPWMLSSAFKALSNIIWSDRYDTERSLFTSDQVFNREVSRIPYGVYRAKGIFFAFNDDDSVVTYEDSIAPCTGVVNMYEFQSVDVSIDVKHISTETIWGSNRFIFIGRNIPSKQELDKELATISTTDS